MIDVDCETTGLQFPYHEAFCWQFYDGETDPVIIYTDERGWRDEVQRWLNRGQDEGLRAWNSCFDFHFADEAGFVLPSADMWHDGMLEAHAVDERVSVSLAATGERLGYPAKTELQADVKGFLAEERKRRAKAAKEAGIEIDEPNFSDVPRNIMTPYALGDTVQTKQICDQLGVILDRTPELRGVVEFERQVMAAKFDVEKRGFPVDEQGYRLLELEVIENLERMDDGLQALAAIGVEDGDESEFNPRSSQQILKALKRRGADLTFVTNDSMDHDNLETVSDDLAAAVLDFRSEFKVLSTYVRPYINKSYETSIRSWKMPFICPDGRIHANYRQIGARTGRMSCSDPNIQNQPRDDLRLRYNFHAEPGMKLVTCDLNSIEMAVFAAYAGEGRLMDAIKRGEDMHTMTADFVGLRERKRPNGIIESRRQRGKTFNFAILYGLGVQGTRKKFQVSMNEARAMRQRYHDAYPEVGRLQARIQYRLEDQGYIKSAWGRRFRVDPRDAYKAANYLVQGTSADILKQALIGMHKDGLPIVALVHDEAIAHVPEGDAEEVKRLMIHHLVDHPRITDRVPLAAEGDIVDRWSEAKKPDFKPRWADHQDMVKRLTT